MNVVGKLAMNLSKVTVTDLDPTCAAGPSLGIE